MLTRLFTAALIAGLIAGIANAALQHFTTTPLILHAETFEGGDHQHGEQTAASNETATAPAAGAEAEAEPWGPEDGIERLGFTTLSAVATGFGYALVLLAAMLLGATRISARSGLAWGLAGFAAIGLAPALGLPPELPGSAAADLGARQAWWFGTALLTAAGLWLALKVSTPLTIALGLVLLVAPHIAGAPHPEGFSSPVPGELSGHFAAASLVVHAVTWALVGAVAGFLWQRGENNASPA